MFFITIKCRECDYQDTFHESAQNFDDGEDNVGHAVIEHASEHHGYGGM